jgi:hypothetical protein
MLGLLGKQYFNVRTHSMREHILYLGDVGVAWQAVFSGARERGGYVCKEAESIAHSDHHAPSPHDVHRVGRGRSYVYIYMCVCVCVCVFVCLCVCVEYTIFHRNHRALSPHNLHRVGRGRTYKYVHTHTHTHTHIITTCAARDERGHL